MNELETIEKELKQKFNSKQANWINYLESSFDMAQKEKQFYKCSIINELIAIELQKMY